MRAVREMGRWVAEKKKVSGGWKGKMGDRKILVLT